MRLTQILRLFRDAVEPDEAITKRQLDALQLSGGGHTVQDEGVDLPAQPRLNFRGAGVAASDDATNGRTNVDVPGGISQADADARYVNETDHTKAAHDALGIDAATLDGIDSLGFAPASHVGSRDGHPLATSSLAGMMAAADKAKLDGIASGYVEVYRSGANQAGVSGWNTIQYNAVAEDAGGRWDLTNFRYVVPSSGLYVFVASAYLTGLTSGLNTLIRATRNGVTIQNPFRLIANGTAATTGSAFLDVLAAGDVVVFDQYVNASFTIQANAQETRMQGGRVG